MSVRVSLNPEAFSDLLLEKCVERILPVSKRIDCSSHRLPFRGQTYNHDIDLEGVPAKLNLLACRSDPRLLVAPTAIVRQSAQARPLSNRRVAESLANRGGERRKDQSRAFAGTQVMRSEPHRGTRCDSAKMRQTRSMVDGGSAHRIVMCSLLLVGLALLAFV